MFDLATFVDEAGSIVKVSAISGAFTTHLRSKSGLTKKRSSFGNYKGKGFKGLKMPKVVGASIRVKDEKKQRAAMGVSFPKLGQGRDPRGPRLPAPPKPKLPKAPAIRDPRITAKQTGRIPGVPLEPGGPTGKGIHVKPLLPGAGIRHRPYRPKILPPWLAVANAPDSVSASGTKVQKIQSWLRV